MVEGEGTVVMEANSKLDAKIKALGGERKPLGLEPVCGVYCIFRHHELIYIGFSSHIQSRLVTHSERFPAASREGWAFSNRTDTIDCIPGFTMAQEATLIKHMRPTFNKQHNKGHERRPIFPSDRFTVELKSSVDESLEGYVYKTPNGLKILVDGKWEDYDAEMMDDWKGRKFWRGNVKEYKETKLTLEEWHRERIRETAITEKWGRLEFLHWMFHDGIMTTITATIIICLWVGLTNGCIK
ncbi:MAG: hypothetical protein ACXABV_20250 [Candidatus Thorarchaeota archaeon]